MHDEGTRHLVSVENAFAESARFILHKACTEAEEGFRTLARCGFWFPPEDAKLFIRAIAGEAGEARAVLGHVGDGAGRRELGPERAEQIDKGYQEIFDPAFAGLDCQINRHGTPLR